MRKVFLAAIGFAALAGAAGLAVAQDDDDHRGGRHDLFQSDANSDGVVTRQELDAGRDANFARLDANRDGQLARDEMRAERGHRGRDGHGGGMQMLTRADANNDGNITRDEFLAQPIQHFDRLDANDDGVISTAERPQRRERGEDGGRGEHHGRANMDANGDHQLSRAEFATMGASHFERLDANHDNRVTREEAEVGRSHHRRGHD